MSVLETSIVKTNDSAKIKAFRKILDGQKSAVQNVEGRKTLEDEYRAIEAEEEKLAEDKLIEFENSRLQNTKKLNQASSETGTQRLSKRAKKNLEKLSKNDTLDDITKSEMVNSLTHKRQKT